LDNIDVKVEGNDIVITVLDDTKTRVIATVALNVTVAKRTTEPRARSKRAELIRMLERRRGASSPEIGQRFGWQPHTVRAAISGLRKAGSQVTRGKDATDTTVYRIAR
jgi:hypothetical protein